MNEIKHTGRHAYLIMAHHKFDQLEQLLSVLDDPRNDIYLHVDKKSDYSSRISCRLKNCLKYSNLIEVPRFPVVWGSYSLIKAELSLFSAAASGHYDYYHLMSGIDFPLKTQDEIHSFFENHPNKEMVHFCEEEWQLHFQDRLRYYHVFRSFTGLKRDLLAQNLNKLSGLMITQQKKHGVDRLRQNPFGVIRAGSNWVSLTDGAVHYLLSRKKDIRHTFRFSYCGDEELVQTVLWNSEFRENLMPNSPEHPGNLRKIDWTRGSPYIFRNEDFEELMDSGCLFARKIVKDEDPRLFERLLQRVSPR